MFGEPISSHGTELKMICPKCGHKSLFCSLSKGTVHCFVCNYGSGLKIETDGFQVVNPDIDLSLQAEVLKDIIDFSDPPTLYRHYLGHRGIYDPDRFLLRVIRADLKLKLLSKWQPSELKRAGILDSHENLCKALAPDRLLIPYWEGERYWTFKTRENPTLFIDENQIRYLVAPGGKIGTRVFRVDKDLFGDVIVTEGEFKCLAAVEMGLKCCATSGINISDRISAALSKILRRAARVFVIYDRDLDSDKDFLSSQMSLKLAQRIGKKAVSVRLPLYSSDKMDLDAFLVTRGVEELKFWMEDAWAKRRLQ